MYTYFSIEVNLSKISTKKLGAVTPSFSHLKILIFIIKNGNIIKRKNKLIFKGGIYG